MWGQLKKPIRRARGTKVTWTAKPTAAELPPKRRELQAVWKSTELEEQAKHRMMPACYQPADDSVPEGLELVIGTAVITCLNLFESERGVHPYTALTGYDAEPRSNSFRLGKDVLMVYAGPIRSVERMWSQAKNESVDVNVIKHTFVGPGGRYIINNLRAVKPI